VMGAGSRVLRVGVIGCGPIGLCHARALASCPQAALAGVCDVDVKRAEAAARAFGARAFGSARELIDRLKPEAVTIATPDHLHVDVALEAMQAGVHVFCEKPLATSADEARRLVEHAEANRVRLGVDYNRRFGFGYRQARAWIDAGRLGELRHAVVHVTDHLPPAYVLEPSKYGILTCLLSHHIDLVRWLCGEVRSVTALARRAKEGAHVSDVVLVLELANGALATITGGYREGQARTWERMEMSGSEGSIAVEDVTREARLFQRSPDHAEIRRENHFEAGDAFHATIGLHVQAFVERIAAGQDPPVTGRDGLRGLEIIEEAVQSIEGGAHA